MFSVPLPARGPARASEAPPATCLATSQLQTAAGPPEDRSPSPSSRAYLVPRKSHCPWTTPAASLALIFT